MLTLSRHTPYFRLEREREREREGGRERESSVLQQLNLQLRERRGRMWKVAAGLAACADVQPAPLSQ